jgi:predicted homoserine dehydrogenase-like protein
MGDGISIASAALRNEATGSTRFFAGDVVATAKRDLLPGENLDGEGGYLVYGKLMQAAASLRAGGLPVGLAHDMKLHRPVQAG